MMPEWAKYQRVDECIECMDVSAEIQAELLRLMPDAYGGESPGEDSWPEPDSQRDAPYKLSVIWVKLQRKTQEALIASNQRGMESEQT